MNSRVSSLISIPCKDLKSFFRYWMAFLTPIHHLTPKVIEVAASMLEQRHELSKSISNDEILDKYLMSEEIRQKIMDDCDIKLAHYHVIVGKLIDGKFILEENDGKIKRINPKFIPNLKEETGEFGFLLAFELK